MIIGRGNPCENDAFEFKAAILDFGRYEQNGKRYSLANNKNGFSTKNTLEKAYLPTLTPKCLGLSKYLKTGLVYMQETGFCSWHECRTYYSAFHIGNTILRLTTGPTVCYTHIYQP